MTAGRFSIRQDAQNERAASELEYCRRISAYLGLSVETVVSMARPAAKRSRERRAPAMTRLLPQA